MTSAWAETSFARHQFCDRNSECFKVVYQKQRSIDVANANGHRLEAACVDLRSGLAHFFIGVGASKPKNQAAEVGQSEIVFGCDLFRAQKQAVLGVF